MPALRLSSKERIAAVGGLALLVNRMRSVEKMVVAEEQTLLS